jgi:hypothetical protein
MPSVPDTDERRRRQGIWCGRAKLALLFFASPLRVSSCSQSPLRFALAGHFFPAQPRAWIWKIMAATTLVSELRIDLGGCDCASEIGSIYISFSCAVLGDPGGGHADRTFIQKTCRQEQNEHKGGNYDSSVRPGDWQCQIPRTCLGKPAYPGLLQGRRGVWQNQTGQIYE